MGQLWSLPGPPFGGTGPAECIVFELFRLIFKKVTIFLFLKKVVVGQDIVLSGRTFGVQNYARSDSFEHIFLKSLFVTFFVFCKKVVDGQILCSLARLLWSRFMGTLTASNTFLKIHFLLRFLFFVKRYSLGPKTARSGTSLFGTLNAPGALISAKSVVGRPYDAKVFARLPKY